MVDQLENIFFWVKYTYIFKIITTAAINVLYELCNYSVHF